MEKWPVSDPPKLVEDMAVLPIQVNGKVRDKVEVALSMNEYEIKELVLTLDSVKRHVADVGQIKRFIIVPGKIVNIVV